MKKANDIIHDDAEPTMRQGAVFLPMWITGLLAVLFYLGLNYVDLYGGNFNQFVYAPFRSTNELTLVIPVDPVVTKLRRGAIVYRDICLNCHQGHGGGNAGQAPALAGSEWVIAPGPNRLIRIPMVGLTGPIKVNGVDWNLSMPAFAGPGGVSDEDLAAVLTYIRNSWGNKAPEVTTEQVQKVRADVMKNHPDQYTAEELNKLSENP